MKIHLSNGIEIKGEVVKNIDLDLMSLTGKDCIDAQNEMLADGHFAQYLEFDKTYHAALAAKALGIPREDIEKANILDFTEITIAVQTFLDGTQAKTA